VAVIHCKACGASYHYEKEGCCPNCGAYNRPPKRNRVTAEGTVQHMTDAAYVKRKYEQVKVCFEEKECYEDQARPVNRSSAPNGSPQITAPGVGKRKVFSFIVDLIVVIVLLILGVVVCAIIAARG